MAFLYASRVQGIGDFIFSSNVLKEIIGASELVKCVENLVFKYNENLAKQSGKNLAKQDERGEFANKTQEKFLNSNETNDYSLEFTQNAKDEFGFESNPQIILAAAGNLRVIFENKADLEKIVLKMPRLISQKAYGLKLAQAVVCLDLNAPNAYQKASSELEMLLKTQKNKENHPLDFAFALLKQSPKTALPLISQDIYQEKCDKSTFLKLQAFDEFRAKHPNSIYELAKLGNEKNKIALIYADGNGLGKIIQSLNARQLTHFSATLDKATKNAFKSACEQVKRDLGENFCENSRLKNENLKFEKAKSVNLNENSSLESENSSKNSRFQNAKGENSSEFKIREIICGGDDLIIICNANIALHLATAFLKHFERLSKGILSKCGCENLGVKFDTNADKSVNFNEKFSTKLDEISLTACAGIAFSNEKFPIHYALKLAKDLCKHAKIQSKALNPHTPPSSLLFHNIQAAMVQNYENFIKNELILGADDLNENSSKSVNLTQNSGFANEKSENSNKNSRPQNEKSVNSNKEKIVRCDFGAYFLRKQEQKANESQNVAFIDDFMALLRAFRSDESPASRLREWLSMLESNAKLAEIELERINEIYAKFAQQNETKFRALHRDLSLQKLIVFKDGFWKTPIYDILSLISITKEVFLGENSQKMANEAFLNGVK